MDGEINESVYERSGMSSKGERMTTCLEVHVYQCHYILMTEMKQEETAISQQKTHQSSIRQTL